MVIDPLHRPEDSPGDVTRLLRQAPFGSEAVGISRATVERDWPLARMWLREKLLPESA